MYMHLDIILAIARCDQNQDNTRQIQSSMFRFLKISFMSTEWKRPGLSTVQVRKDVAALNGYFVHNIHLPNIY